MERTDRIAEEIKKEISSIIRSELKDPEIPVMTSVLAVRVTKDLKYGKVYISVLGDDHVKERAQLSLNKAAGYIRRELGQRLRIRCIPQLEMIVDDSIEKGVYLSKLIDEVNKKD